ncbi:MAG: nucleoside deaminase [Deltaproteobacteria bacterium]|nr:nucleoside deaminase [Deltaproteobacteria bacterium]
MMPHPCEIVLTTPDWFQRRVAELPEFLPNPEDRMRLVLEFARANVEHDTGGPFAAGVFERASGRLVAMGVNRVVPTSCSSAHAEIMALSLAQKRLQTYDLGSGALPEHELVVNWRPCAMCFGAVLWSGIRHLCIAGSGPELEELTGFDEGPIHPDWKNELTRRGIDVEEGLLRAEALELFRWFRSSGRVVYNARQS